MKRPPSSWLNGIRRQPLSSRRSLLTLKLSTRSPTRLFFSVAIDRLDVGDRVKDHAPSKGSLVLEPDPQRPDGSKVRLSPDAVVAPKDG
ncbi:hypothetical protein [Paracoccus rhizosphaerae]|uniref:Uncharacterized protein n=1 Tax=Paracoccus rhizosphaerae TaxID=1133347 RepID=A0ABV6CS96_9RHOB|nr:hypothetical protein [Paracoccus rhizosphaerae]